MQGSEQSSRSEKIIDPDAPVVGRSGSVRSRSRLANCGGLTARKKEGFVLGGQRLETVFPVTARFSGW
jgi:hypothetical protein